MQSRQGASAYAKRAKGGQSVKPVRKYPRNKKRDADGKPCRTLRRSGFRGGADGGDRHPAHGLELAPQTHTYPSFVNP